MNMIHTKSSIIGEKIGYEKHKTLNQVFEEQVKKRPDQSALIMGKERLTYHQYNICANRLARYLIQHKIMPGDVVAVQMETSFERMIAFMALFKIGAAYLPIRLTEAEEQIRYILKNSGAKAILTNTVFDAVWDAPTYQVNRDFYMNENGEDLDVDFSSENLAYIMYTSGSTGVPKGVMISHRNVMNFLTWMCRELKIDERDMILQKAPYTFDASVWDTFLWFFGGASLCLSQPGSERKPGVLAQEIEDYGITRLNFIPSMLKTFLNYVNQRSIADRLQSLKTLISGGEPLPKSTADMCMSLFEKNPQFELINAYGPTETTVAVTWFSYIPGKDLETVPIGKPIANTNAYILDEMLKPVKKGEAGELYIGGDNVGQGYFKDTILTESKFILDPFCPSQKMYRTGDKARMLPDGSIAFIGRIDNQIKIRGYRVELEEIETVMKQYSTIENAIAVLFHQNLVAFFTSQIAVEEKQIEQYLAKYLPKYMIPIRFIQINHFPLMENGKIDRKAVQNLPISLSLGEMDEPLAIPKEPALYYDILTQIHQVLGDEFPIPITLDTVLSESGIDSIAFVQIIVEIETKYDIEFEDDMMLFSSYTDVRSFVQYVEAQLSNVNNEIGETI